MDEKVREVIAAYDAAHPRWRREAREARVPAANQAKEREQQARAPADGPASVRTAAVQTSNDWWQQLDQRVYQCIKLWIEQWWEPQKRVLIDAVGQVFGEHRASVRETITNLKERVIRLETTSNFEERFTRLAHEVKRGSEIPQGELLEKIEALQRQLDDLKRVAGQPGPQGPPGKLPRVKEYVAECVHYESDVVTHEGALYQAKRDTAQPPGGSDWVCVARAGRDALTPTIRGTYNVYEKYQKLDIIVSDGAAFIASKDNPGLLPGPDWQLLSRQGKRGQRGEKGDPGPRGEKGDQGPAVMPQLVSSEIDENYNLTILRSDNSLEIIPLRPAFERFLLETNS